MTGIPSLAKAETTAAGSGPGDAPEPATKATWMAVAVGPRPIAREETRHWMASGAAASPTPIAAAPALPVADAPPDVGEPGTAPAANMEHSTMAVNATGFSARTS